VPSFLEVYGEPTENVIIDELKNWGHDCFVFQFADIMSSFAFLEIVYLRIVFGTTSLVPLMAQIQMRPSYIPTEVRLCKNSTA
jgi:hypothetical protein